MTTESNKFIDLGTLNIPEHASLMFCVQNGTFI